MSDHDPQVIRLTLNPPTAGAGGPYWVDEGGSVTLAATGADPDGPASRTVSVRATDPAGLSHTVQAEVRIRNVAPMVAVHNSGPATVGAPVTVTFAAATDPSAADVAAGFAYAIACDGGVLAYGLSPSATCSFTLPGTYTILGGIRDKDGDATEYTTTVTVTASPDGSGSVTGGGWINPDGGERANIVVTARNSGGRVRIKIWRKADGAVVVDTQPGAPDGAAPATALGGGAIQVREK